MTRVKLFNGHLAGHSDSTCPYVPVHATLGHGVKLQGIAYRSFYVVRDSSESPPAPRRRNDGLGLVKLPAMFFCDGFCSDERVDVCSVVIVYH